MTRRSFITRLLLGTVAPVFLPGTGRKWRFQRKVWIPRHASVGQPKLVISPVGFYPVSVSMDKIPVEVPDNEPVLIGWGHTYYPWLTHADKLIIV